MDSQTTEVTKLSNIIRELSRAEFILEQFGAARIAESLGPKVLLEFLGVFEIGLLYFKLKKYFASNSRIYLSEPQSDEKLSKQKEDLTNVFSYQQMKVKTTSEEVQDLKQSIKDLLKRIRDSKPFSGFNRGYQDQLKRSSKGFGLIGKLPMELEEESKIEEKNHSPQRVAELLFLIRPVVYCFSLVYFSQKSYKPYLISLVIDLIRLVLQSKMKFTNIAEIQEFKKRNKDLIINYLLRNPVYSQIIRKRILDPLLDRLFPRFTFIKTIIIYLLEIRSSLSMLM